MKDEELITQQRRVNRASAINEEMRGLSARLTTVKLSTSITIETTRSQVPMLKLDGSTSNLLSNEQIRECDKVVRDMIISNINEKCSELRKEFEAL